MLIVGSAKIPQCPHTNCIPAEFSVGLHFQPVQSGSLTGKRVLKLLNKEEITLQSAVNM